MRCFRRGFALVLALTMASLVFATPLVSPAVAAPVAQAPDAANLLAASAVALEGVDTMRYTLVMTNSPAASEARAPIGGVFSSIEGEFQAPDRYRWAQEVGFT